MNSQAFFIETSLPIGLTIDEYRRGRSRKPTRLERLKRLAGLGAAPAAA